MPGASSFAPGMSGSLWLNAFFEPFAALLFALSLPLDPLPPLAQFDLNGAPAGTHYPSNCTFPSLIVLTYPPPPGTITRDDHSPKEGAQDV